MSSSDLAPRRVAFSSCDECRRAKVACDARRVRRNSENPHALSSCTRCRDRQRPCTFEWMNHSNGGSVAAARAGFSRKSLLTTGTKNTTTKPNARVESNSGRAMTDYDNQDSHTRTSNLQEQLRSLPSRMVVIGEDLIDQDEQKWLRTIYERVWETVFGSWMGKYSNPFAFGEHSLSDMCISIHQLCRQLDRWIEEGYETPDHALDSQALTDFGKRETDSQINRSLDNAINAFAARWLPLTLQAPHPRLYSDEVITNLWRCAHKDMLKVINRPSYRSMLTLLLFALTPIPVGLSEEEELDRVSSQVCVHSALQQIQELRAHQRILQFSGNRVPVDAPTRILSTSPHSLATASFINAESIAYWAALTFDTSASLTLSCRPLLSSGLFGFESETCWRMLRSCTEIFRESSKGWSNIELELTDERANQIIAGGAAWKCFLWKLTAIFKEALRDGHDESEVRRAFRLLSDAIDQYNTTYRDLLNACQRRIEFFGQETKLRWYVLMLHYHLPILMLVDIVAATDRKDLLAQLTAKRIEAESSILNCLVFGLNNKYTLSLSTTSSTSTPTSSNTQSASITVPLTAVDPYPHHVVAAVKLMQKSIDRDFAARKIGAEVYRNLRTTLIQVLGQLPQASKSVQMARATIEDVGSPT